MTDWGSSIGRGVRVGETLLWTSAALLVLTAHVGAAAWLMREQPISAADASPPPAIMIELAPEPEAAVTEKTEISPDFRRKLGIGRWAAKGPAMAIEQSRTR